MHVELPMPDRFPGSECEAKEGEHLVRVIPTTVYILTVDDLRLLGMQHQLAGRQAIRQCTPQRLRLHGAFAVTNGIVRVSLERDVRISPRYPHVERVVQERFASRGLITPPCGVPAVRDTMLPSSICTGAFSQRSM